MLLRAIPLAAIVLAAPLCGGEDRVALLEDQKAELLATTVEKKEFWAQIERKGAVAKEMRKLEDELAALSAEVAVQEARRDAVAPPMAEALAVNGRAEAVKAEIDAREAALADAIDALEEKLAAWKRARAPEGSG
jgi:hypothetical protein